MAASNSTGIILTAVTAPALALGLVVGLILLGGEDTAAACNPAGDNRAETISLTPGTVDTGIAGYGPGQLANAAEIIAAGKELRLGVRDITIGVMTAMGESDLTVLDRGDAAGPDSRGLFQQRDNGAWGTYQDRMNPYTSAANFFQAMMQVKNRESLEPTIVANRTQRNADPYHYVKYWEPAAQVVEALGNADTGLNLDAGGHVCSTTQLVAGDVSGTGWASPGDGPITSGYGIREDPVTGAADILHSGVDLQAGGDGGPIRAAQDGVVIDTYTDTAGGWNIDIDHGDGIMTRYAHMWANGVLVDPGDHVTAGQQIGRTGSSGWSTGAHLHFEVHVNGSPTDPVPFMAEAGMNLG